MSGSDTQARVPLSALRSRPRQCVVTVLGVGRSGTSVITRGLQALGVELGDQLRPGGGKNPTGFFEDEGLLAINKRLKKLLGIRSASVSLIEPARWHTPAVEALRHEAVTTVRQRFGRYDLWGYKYARTLRLLPFWREVFRILDIEVRYLMVIRNPLSVARSRAKLNPRRGTQEKSDLEWLVNVVPYFREIREQAFVVVDYDQLMADPVQQFERIAKALHLPLTAYTRTALNLYARQFIVPEMRHTHFADHDLDSTTSVNGLTRDAYRWLLRLATDSVDPHAPEIWQDWTQIERGLSALAPVLHHIDCVEAEYQSAKRSLLSPFRSRSPIWRKLRRKWQRLARRG